MPHTESRTTRVAVVIPVFNKERFIRETLDSVLAQTYPYIDVIVVDDGSSDATPQILQHYASRVTLLEHPNRENRGQAAAINLGIRASRSDYVAVLDADDLWEPEKLERQVRFLEEHPDVGFVYANGYEIDESGTRRWALFPPDHVEPSDPEEMLVHCPLGCPSGYLVRRRLFDAVGDYDESLRSAQDHDMLIRLTEVSKVAYMSERLWYKREHPESLSARHAKRAWGLGFRILDNASRRYPYSRLAKRRRRAVLHFRLGQCLAAEKSYLRAARHFVLAALFDPWRSVRTLLRGETAR